MNDDSKLIILTAGGTGGHIFPAQALAEDLLSRGYRVGMITDQRGKKFQEDLPDIDLHVIRAGTLGRGIFGKIKGLINMGIGMVQARLLVGKLKPYVVVGFGGYPSVPAVMAAQKKGIPTILHEQNAVLGKANVFLSKKADRIALSLPKVEGLEESDRIRAVVTGNPVRHDISALFMQPYPAIDVDGPLNMLVFGGSLGATVFGEVVPEAIKLLPDTLRSRIRVTQQCRENDLEEVKARYAELGIEAELSTFFTDMAERLAKTHLVVSRSGASTVAELSTAGRPAIYVPYPHHGDNQQAANAEAVCAAGGAWVMMQSGFTPEALSTQLETFLHNPQMLFQAGEAARECGKADASRKLGNLVTAIASGWDKNKQKPFDLTQGHDR